MISQNVIDEVKNRLVQTYKPLAIYLFGSYAWGCPDEESDLDLLVVIDKYDKNRYQILADGHRALIGLYVSKDILVYSKEEWENFSKDQRKFCYKIKHEGKLIYGTA